MSSNRTRHDWRHQLQRARAEARQRADEEAQAAERLRRQRAHAAQLARQHQMFLDAVGPVVPLRVACRRMVRPPAPPPIPRQRLADERAVLGELLRPVSDWETRLESGEALTFLRQGLPRDVLRKLRRGHWVVQGVLDLHGHRSEEARLALGQFLAAALQRDYRCVRIIHGKGLGSARREPVLKGKVKRFLQQREEVMAFCEARNVDGGSGAVLVLLKSRTRTTA